MVCHTIQSERKIKDSTSAIIRTCTANQLKSWSDGGRDLARQCGSRDGLLACAEVGLAIGTALGFLDDDGNIIEFDFYAATRGHLGGEATAAEGRRIGESFGFMGVDGRPVIFDFYAMLRGHLGGDASAYARKINKMVAHLETATNVLDNFTQDTNVLRLTFTQNLINSYLEHDDSHVRSLAITLNIRIAVLRGTRETGM